MNSIDSPRSKRPPIDMIWNLQNLCLFNRVMEMLDWQASLERHFIVLHLPHFTNDKSLCSFHLKTPATGRLKWHREFHLTSWCSTATVIVQRPLNHPRCNSFILPSLQNWTYFNWPLRSTDEMVKTIWSLRPIDQFSVHLTVLKRRSHLDVSI